MTSQLNVDTIVDKAGTGGVSLTQSPSLTTPSLTGMSNTSTYTSEGGAVTQTLVQGLAKVWFLLEGDITTPVNRDSINSSSVTDEGTGDYTVAFTNSFTSADNACSSDAGYTQAVGGPYNASSYYYGSSSSRRIRSSNMSGTLTNCEQIGASIFGDLA